jgi:hypothetical protein
MTGMKKERWIVIFFSWKTRQNGKMNFGFENNSNIVRHDNLVIHDRPSEVLVGFSNMEEKRPEKGLASTNIHLAALASRLGFY